jgi:hypothetical protein
MFKTDISTGPYWETSIQFTFLVHLFSLSVCLSVCLSVYLSIHPSARPPACLHICLYIFLPSFLPSFCFPSKEQDKCVFSCISAPLYIQSHTFPPTVSTCFHTYTTLLRVSTITNRWRAAVKKVRFILLLSSFLFLRFKHHGIEMFVS